MIPRALLSLWLCLVGLVGCGSCDSCGEKPLARVVEMHGRVGVARAPAPDDFAGASVGTAFALGDAARTGRESTAKLELDDGNLLVMRPSTTIRFSATRPGARGRRIELLSGEATLTISEDTWLDTGNGTLRARRGTQLGFRRANGNLELVVLVGQARLEVDGEPPMEIEVGTAVMLEGPAADRERTGTAESAARSTEEPPPAASVEEVPELEGQIELGADLRADHTDFTLGAGDGIVLRDPNPPTAIGVQTSPPCAGPALVQLYEGTRLVGSARGTGSIPVTFAEGAFTYRVHCITDGTITDADAPAAQGRVRVVRATGQAPLPRNAPISNVEADGRTYQILYSHRLPSVSIRWPNGPNGSGTLVIAGGRRIPVSGPRHRFNSGSLSEGTHRVYFESGGRRSRDTTIVIRFDPVAAAASLESPADGSFAPGQTVRVSGMALPGHTVMAAGQTIQVGADQRFSADVVAPRSGALVIRLVRGDHTSVFLRRPIGAVQ